MSAPRTSGAVFTDSHGMALGTNSAHTWAWSRALVGAGVHATMAQAQIDRS